MTMAETAPPSGDSAVGERPVSFCPYLGGRDAGREPHRYATSHNVCHARPGHGGRSYSRVDRNTQIRCCLEPVEGWPACRSFVAAMNKGIPPLWTPSGPIVQTRRKRRRSRSQSRWGNYRVTHDLPRLIPALLIIVLSMLFGLLVGKTATWLW